MRKGPDSWYGNVVLKISWSRIGEIVDEGEAGSGIGFAKIVMPVAAIILLITFYENNTVQW